MRTEFMSEYLLLALWGVFTFAQIFMISKKRNDQNYLRTLMLLNLASYWIINVFGIFELTDIQNLATLNMFNGGFTVVVFLKALAQNKG